ncbi:MAG: ribonuclease Y [Firmicutes bacterium]|nr:ribonuclease Y [Bacillota bacterium]
MTNNLMPSLLAAPETLWYVLLPVFGLVFGAAIGVAIYIVITKRKMAGAKEDAKKILEKAIADAKNLRKEAQLEAKEAFLKQRGEFEQEMKDRQNEVRRGEQRIAQREENLDKKEDGIGKKEEVLDKKIEALEKTREDLKTKEAQIAEVRARAEAKVFEIEEQLQKTAMMTREEAKAKLIEAMEDEAKRDAAKMVRDIEAAAREEADGKAREIVSLAVQKCAVDHSSEITVSAVPLPNEEMKGRIIGREGRNIRALEIATGIDLIIDDTPEAVVLSGFDPVRREVARIALEKLISDGRIHPARIEDIVERTRKELDFKIKEMGENACFEAGVMGVHADLVKLLGRMKYRTSYGQNVLKHSLEVSYLAGALAVEIGADVALCKRAGLLHDIGKAVDHEVEGTHISIGADLAKKYRENKDVIHCIAAHHNDIPPETMEAVIVQCADAISGARPGARRESLENYVKRLEKLETIANSFAGVEKSFAIQAGREVRIMVKPEVVDDAATLFMAKEIARQIEREMDYPGQIKVNVIREMRSVEYAK